MKRLAIVLALSVGAFGLLACGGGSGDDTPDAFVVPTIDADPSQPDGGSTAACNPVAQTGCNANEKCTWIFDTADLGHTGCVANGSVAGGGACEWPADGIGADNCAADSSTGGYLCISGVCTEICTYDPTDSCPNGEACGPWAVYLSDVDSVGTCAPTCDPVTQDCPIETQACYMQLYDGTATCVGVPACADGLVQGDTCCQDPNGNCYLNGCDKGYQGIMTGGICAFYCRPIDNWLGNEQGLAGDQSSVTCGYNVGDRPGGPGPTFECRYLQTAGAENVAADKGFCLNPNDFGGSCALFDLPQLEADIVAEVTIDQAYCDTNPERCMFDCVSAATLDALGTKSVNPGAFRAFVDSRKQSWMDHLRELGEAGQL